MIKFLSIFFLFWMAFGGDSLACTIYGLTSAARHHGTSKEVPYPSGSTNFGSEISWDEGGQSQSLSYSCKDWFRQQVRNYSAWYIGRDCTLGLSLTLTPEKMENFLVNGYHDATFVDGSLIFVPNDGADIQIKNPGSWNGFDLNLKVARLYDCADGDGDGINDDGSDPDGKEFRYFIWIDYFRGGEYVDIPDDYMEPINTNGILFGLFGGSPKGCHAVAAKVSLKGQNLAWHLHDDRVTLLGHTADLPMTELTYGYRIVSQKAGSSTISVDSLRFPVSFSDSKYYEYSANAQWINPQCYWSPSSASSPGFFGGILDIFRGIFRQ